MFFKEDIAEMHSRDNDAAEANGAIAGSRQSEKPALLRPALGVVAGIAISAALIGFSDTILVQLAPSRFSPNGRSTDSLMLTLITIYTTGFSFLAGYIAARIALQNERRVGLVYAALQFVVGMAVQLATGAETPVGWAVTLTVLPSLAIAAGAYAVAISRGRTGQD